MSNVFDLKTGQRRTAASLESFAAKRKRADALRASREQRAVFSLLDQSRAAANLHRLLEQLSAEHGLSKRKVARAAGLGGAGDTDSTKRFDPYTLPERATESRIGRLAKKPGKYFEIADSIAALLDEPADGYLCQIFEGCSFGTGQEHEADWEDEGWARLSYLLRCMSMAVIKQEDVEGYWRQTLQLNGSHDSRSGELRPSHNALDGVGCAGGLAGYSTHPSDLPPIPSVLLGKRLQMEPVIDTIVLEDGQTIDAEFKLYLEVRLALAPVSQDGVPGPMIEFRSRLDATHEELGDIPLDNQYSDGSGGSDEIRFAYISGVKRRIERFPILNSPPAEWRWEGVEHAYYAWEEISPALLRSLFGDDALPFEMVFKDRLAELPEVPPSRFPSGYPGYYLSAHLLSDALKTELSEACRDCASKLAALREELERRIIEEEISAELRWSGKSEL